MNGAVYYLSFFAEEGGFLFPDELPHSYYSPGLFLILPDEKGSLAHAYSFDAMDSGRRVTLTLVRANESDPQSSLYAVKTEKYGSFWFNLTSIRPRFRYIGNRRQLADCDGFSVAISVDADKLERACGRFNFYFIGSTLQDDEL